MGFTTRITPFRQPESNYQIYAHKEDGSLVFIYNENGKLTDNVFMLFTDESFGFHPIKVEELKDYKRVNIEHIELVERLKEIE